MDSESVSATNKEKTDFIRIVKTRNVEKVAEALASAIHPFALANAASKYEFVKGKTALMMASEAGDADMAKLLIKHNANVDAQTEKDKWTALQYAVEGHLGVVQVLVASNCNLELQDLMGLRACHYAARRGTARIMELLIAHKANLGAITQDGSSVLHFCSTAGNAAVLPLLLKYSSVIDNINRPNQYGATALHLAARKNSSDIIAELIAHSANIELKCHFHFTALHHASEVGSVDAIRTLLDRSADMAAKTDAGMTALHIAVNANNSNSYAVVSLILTKMPSVVDLRDADGWTALHYACRHSDAGLVDELLHHRANVETKDTDGGMAIHFAASHNNVDAIKSLIRHRVDVESKDNTQSTALAFASENNNLEAVKTLLSFGADINAIDSFGRSSLHWASRGGHFKVVKELLLRGGDAGAKDKNGKTPLMSAQLKHPKCVQLFESYVPSGVSATPVNPATTSTVSSSQLAVVINVDTQPIQLQQSLAEITSPVVVPPEINIRKRKATVDRPNTRGYSNHRGRSSPPRVTITATNVVSNSDLLEIPLSEVVVEEEVHCGQFSKLFRGVWRGSVVAIKQFQGGDHSEIMQSAELSMLAKLTHHPRILTSMAICYDEESVLGYPVAKLLVMEWMSGGSLFQALHDHSAEARERGVFRPTQLSQKLKIATDVADGLRFLHSSGIVHRHLNSRHVLLDCEGRAKISDFGLSAFTKPDAFSVVRSTSGSMGWMAPETMVPSSSPSADAFSLGVVIWELQSGNIPWEGMDADQVFESVAVAHRTLEIEDRWHQRLKSLLQRLFGPPVNRPSADDVHNELLALMVDTVRTENDGEAAAFVCPISYEVMFDPVICADGHSYERSHIEKWLRYNSRSPKTNLVLPSKTLIPNVALKVAIEAYRARCPRHNDGATR